MTPPSEKPRRRWFQFSLRTLFVVVTMAAISMPAITWGLREWRRHRELPDAIAEMEKIDWSWVQGNYGGCYRKVDSDAGD